MKCKYCNGNDKDMPCLYPSENKDGCLRDIRIKSAREKKFNTIPEKYEIKRIERG